MPRRHRRDLARQVMLHSLMGGVKYTPIQSTLSELRKEASRASTRAETAEKSLAKAAEKFETAQNRAEQAIAAYGVLSSQNPGVTLRSYKTRGPRMSIETAQALGLTTRSIPLRRRKTKVVAPIIEVIGTGPGPGAGRRMGMRVPARARYIY